METKYYLTVACDEPEKIVAAISSGAAAELIVDYGLFLVSSPELGEQGLRNHVWWSHKKRYDEWNAMWTKVFYPQAVSGVVFLLPANASPFAVNDIVNQMQNVLGRTKKYFYRVESNGILAPGFECMSIIVRHRVK